jgi:hypothetical protein
VLEGTASWGEFQQVQDRYFASARDIAQERKSAWEREMEEFRAEGR